MATNLAHHLTAVEESKHGSNSSSSLVTAVRHDEAPSICAFCYGTGMEVVLGKGARRCRCRTEDKKAKLMEAALIPRRYSDCTLQSYQPAKGNGSQLLAFNNSFRLAREYPAVDRGLLFMGSVGVGKTHLSVAIIRDLIEKKGVHCLFYEFGSLLKAIQNSYMTLNSNYMDFMTAHPEIERLTRGPELCHRVVHIDEGRLHSGDLPFDVVGQTTRYHRMNYSEDAPTASQKNRLARFALNDERAYRILKPRGSSTDELIEPAWMHRQAEHFSACLLVPRGPLLTELEQGKDPAHYGTHVRLAEMFRVSKRVIQIRLKKLGLIEEYEPGKFRNVEAVPRLNFS
jgi:hypothetical protein